MNREQKYVLANGQICDRATWEKEQELGAFYELEWEQREQEKKQEERENCFDTIVLYMASHGDPLIVKASEKLNRIFYVSLAAKKAEIEQLKEWRFRDDDKREELEEKIMELEKELKKNK
ncbi:MAG: hypothetical protein Q4D41_07005 [Prevotellaceae bacterium]|nr:hypothetical protein [Prevotellaceae bacterium]